MPEAKIDGGSQAEGKGKLGKGGWSQGAQNQNKTLNRWFSLFRDCVVLHPWTLHFRNLFSLLSITCSSKFF